MRWLILLCLFACTKKQEPAIHTIAPKEIAIVISNCKVTKGVHSTGVRVVQFRSGNEIVSHMAERDATPEAINEELNNLNNMEICQK